MPKNNYKTWVEINQKALNVNIKSFRKILPPKTGIMAVVKSNAYGHDMSGFAQATEKLVDWFGVDSLAEGLTLRRNSVKNPILVLGYTLPERFSEALANDISLTFYNQEEIKYLPVGLKIHLKIDTGMRRQGIYPKNLPSFLKDLKRRNINLEGIYTHFASAKDQAYSFYTLQQLENFKKALAILAKNGHKNIIKHAAATGGALLYPETYFDLVRLGIGLYGYWPSAESKIQFLLPNLKNFTPLNFQKKIKGAGKSKIKKFELKPVLAWKTIVAQVKKIKKGDYIGYDLTEKAKSDTKIAILPVGYWHGYDRRFSSIGEVIIKNKRCRVLGRVSMDMIVVDAGWTPIKIGTEALLLGASLPADELALKINSISYELLTRINPLIPRIYV